MARADPGLDAMITKINSEMKKESEDRKFHRMAKVLDFLEMWQGSQNLRATQKESSAQNKHMTVEGYISDTEEIFRESCSLFQHDGAAAFKLSGRSPLPLSLSAKNLPGGRTEILTVRQIRRINRHPVESDEDSPSESISDTEDWLNWNGDLDNPNDSEDNCAADVQPDIQQEESIKDPDCAEQQDVSAAPNVRGLFRPIRKSTRQAEMMLMTVNAIKTGRKKGVKKMFDRVRQCCTSFFMYLD